MVRYGLCKTDLYQHTYVIIQSTQKAVQLHQPTSGSVHLKKPQKILVEASKEGAFQVNRRKASKLCFNLVGRKQAKEHKRLAVNSIISLLHAFFCMHFDVQIISVTTTYFYFQ